MNVFFCHCSHLSLFLTRIRSVSLPAARSCSLSISSVLPFSHSSPSAMAATAKAFLFICENYTEQSKKRRMCSIKKRRQPMNVRHAINAKWIFTQNTMLAVCSLCIQTTDLLHTLVFFNLDFSSGLHITSGYDLMMTEEDFCFLTFLFCFRCAGRWRTKKSLNRVHI